jgi:hypothetical protein
MRETKEELKKASEDGLLIQFRWISGGVSWKDCVIYFDKFDEEWNRCEFRIAPINEQKMSESEILENTKVMKAAFEGKPIQILWNNKEGTGWKDLRIGHKVFDWNRCSYRIKPFSLHEDVEQAYKDGKSIECRSNEAKDEDPWRSVKNPSWSWDIFDYRIREKNDPSI